jgi:transcriptional regulator with XRE-family HTH domain
MPVKIPYKGHYVSETKSILPLPVKRAVQKLGADISNARRRRRIPMALMAERAGIGRMTLVRIEQGHPEVSMGGYARVLFVLGLTTRLDELADVRHDATGLVLEQERLSKRIRMSPKATRTK